MERSGSVFSANPGSIPHAIQHLYIDKSYDKTHLSHITQQEYWTQNVNVAAYQQANLDTIIFGRVDDSVSDDIFTLGARSTFKFIRTANDPTYGSSAPGGGPTNVVINSVRDDFTKWTLWNTSTSYAVDELKLHVGSLIHQGGVLPSPSTLTPIAGNAIVRNDGNFALWDMSNVKGDVLDAAAIVNTSPTASTYNISNLQAFFRYSTATACSIMTGVATNTADLLSLSLPPNLAEGPSCTVTRVPASGSTASVLWNTPS
jgi:hypothetical protein